MDIPLFSPPMFGFHDALSAHLSAHPSLSSTISLSQPSSFPDLTVLEPLFDSIIQSSTNILPPVAGGTDVLATPHRSYATNTQVQPSRDPAPTLGWDQMRENAVILQGRPRVFVPQVPYSQGNGGWCAAPTNTQAPIVFRAENSPEWGVPLRDLLSNHPPHLTQGNDPAFMSSGPSISLRLQWPGYQPYNKRILTGDYTAQRRPINRMRLAKLVARAVEAYMGLMSQQQMTMGSNLSWVVGPVGITVEDVILVSLHQMSKGSWQPQLRLRRLPGANPPLGVADFM